MECQTCSESLTAFMDDELGGEEEKELKNHLGQCKQCNQEYQSLLYSYELTDRIPLLEPNPVSWAKIRSEITQLQTGDPRWIFRLIPFSPIRWVPVTTGALGLVILSLFLVKQPDTEKARSFRTFLQEREQIEPQHVNFFGDKGSGVESLHPNPFIVHHHNTEVNPFTLVE